MYTAILGCSQGVRCYYGVLGYSECVHVHVILLPSWDAPRMSVVTCTMVYWDTLTYRVHEYCQVPSRDAPGMSIVTMVLQMSTIDVFILGFSVVVNVHVTLTLHKGHGT